MAAGTVLCTAWSVITAGVGNYITVQGDSSMVHGWLALFVEKRKGKNESSPFAECSKCQVLSYRCKEGMCVCVCTLHVGNQICVS